MHSSLDTTVASVLVTGIQDMWIPTQVLVPGQSLKAIDTWALVDSRADISCIDWDFVKKHKIPRTKLATPIPVNNVDESANKTGIIQYTCTIFLHIEGVTMEETLHVLHYGNENVILGRPWLKKTNPKINWAANTMEIEESLDQYPQFDQKLWKDYETWKNLFWKPPPAEVKVVSTNQPFKYTDYKPPEEFCHRAHTTYAIGRIVRCGSRFLQASTIARVSQALELAAAQKQPEVSLPPEYSAFEKVFEEPSAGTLPPSWPYDHEINMNDTFVPKVGKVYPLFPDKQKATDNFIDEHLKSGKICPSSLPQASPFFFIKKKDGKLQPCQDYRYLNEHTVCDGYPLPLISDLLDKLQGAKLFTKFDVRWGYIQQRTHQGWAPMERSLHDPSRTFWADGNVLRNDELPHNLPMLHEWLLPRYDSGRMAAHIHGRPTHLLPRCQNPQRTNQAGTHPDGGVKPSSGIVEMPIRSPQSWIPRNDHPTQWNHHGPSQTRQNRGLAYPN